MAIEPLPSGPPDPVPLAADLERLRRRLGLPAPDARSILEQRWSEWLGDPLARSVHLVAFRHGVVRLAAADPAVVEHLRWRSAELVAAAAAWEPPVTIERLEVVVRTRA